MLEEKLQCAGVSRLRPRCATHACQPHATGGGPQAAALPFGACTARALFCAAISAVIGCSPGEQPTSRGRTVSANPPAVPSAPSVVNRSFSDPSLQRLADAGAEFGIGTDKDQSTYLDVSFCDALIDANVFADLARILEADAAVGAPPSLQDVGGAALQIHLTLKKCQVAQQGLSPLNGAKRLAILTLLDTAIDDTTFAGVASLPGLRHLHLDGSGVSDHGLGFLARCSQLNRFSAKNTSIGDATIESLGVARSLYLLEVGATKVTDKGLVRIGQFPNLVRLDLSECDVTDAGVASLGGLAQLTSLNLDGTAITDSGVRQLQGLSLEALGLANTDVSDVCLRYLAEMRHLGFLNVAGTWVTRAAAARALPNTSVVGGRGGEQSRWEQRWRGHVIGTAKRKPATFEFSFLVLS